MNEIRNFLFCTIDDLNKCVRISQVADCGSEQCERITMITVVFPNDNIRRASEQLNLDDPLPLDVSKDRLKLEVSKLVIAHYGNEYQWMNETSFDVVSDKEIWHIGRRLSCLILMLFASLTTFALNETVDGITWHYKKSGSYAIIQPPNINNIENVNNYTLRPAHEGQLPRILTIPAKLGGLEVYAVAMGSIQLSDNSDVELIIVPPTIQKGISGDAILGDFIKCELFYSNYGKSRYKWFFKNAKEHGLKGVLFLGSNHYRNDPYNSGYDVIKINGSSDTDVIMVDNNDSSSGLWPQVYYVEGMVEPYAGEISNYGVRYGAAKVEIAPVGGVFEESIDVSLACTNSTANLYYTLDGSEPTTNVTDRCFLYDTPITLMHAATVKAVAHIAEYPYTIVYSERYALGQTLAPSIVATDGNVFNWSGNTVILATETDNAEIRYTLDGGEPTETSDLYTGPFTVDDTTTVKAKAFKTDWFESDTSTATFTREWYTAATPVIEPSGGEFVNTAQDVAISCATDGATILYTTDGSDPKTNGREYTKPFTVYKSCTVRAIAVKSDWKYSAETTATFTRSESLSEAANFYGYTMETGATAAWTVDETVSHDGVSSIRSNGSGSYVQTSVRGAGTLSFWWRAQCEEPDDGEFYDYGAFKVGSAGDARIAGNDTGWVFFSTNVTTTGKHTLRWEYQKDDEGSYQPDCVWVDQVQWIPADGSGYTVTTPEPVPYSWLTQYNLGVAEGDFEAAGNAANGKMSWGRPMSVWQDYVAGTDPTNLESMLTAKIEMQGDFPLVTWEPNLNTNGDIRVYKVYGSETLEDGGNWQYPTNSLHRFFKVKVEMP